MAPSEQIIEDYLRSYPQDGYHRYHAPRYRKLLKLAQGYYHDGQLILDIGRSRLTDMMATALGSKLMHWINSEIRIIRANTFVLT